MAESLTEVDGIYTLPSDPVVDQISTAADLIVGESADSESEDSAAEDVDQEEEEVEADPIPDGNTLESETDDAAIEEVQEVMGNLIT